MKKWLIVARAVRALVAVIPAVVTRLPAGVGTALQVAGVALDALLPPAVEPPHDPAEASTR